MRVIALDYPDTAFLMGSSFMPDPAYPNLAVFDNYIQDASYLSGIIAGAMTETGNIGMVGGFPIPEVNRLMHAFMAGVKEMKPDATFQVSFIGSWFDPPKAKETAFVMIENGADISIVKELLRHDDIASTTFAVHACSVRQEARERTSDVSGSDASTQDIRDLRR